MFRIASLDQMSDQKLSRLTRRLAVLLVLGSVAFSAFYFLDRHPVAGPSLVDRQIARAEDAVRTAPDNVPARMALASLYLSAERFDAASEQYGQILSIQPEHKLALLGRGTALFLAENLAEAEGMYQKLIDTTAGGEFTMVDPAVEEAHYYLGTIASRTGRLDRAVAEYGAALAIEPTDADACYGLGTAYLALGRPADAIEPLRMATAFVPLEWTDPYTALQDAYTRLGRAADAAWAGAMIDLTQGRYGVGKEKLEPLAGPAASIDVLIGMGYATEGLGDTPAAADWYRAALAVDPTNFNAQQGIGRTTDERGPSSTPPTPAATKPGGSGSDLGAAR